ncbi:MAG: hypothetical protein AB7I18_07350 [Candidatus Berkiella sp.]
MAEELGWPIEGFKGAFDELIQQGLVKADLVARVIYIPNAIKYNKPQSPNVVKSWASHWDEIPECELKKLAYQQLKSFVKDIGTAFAQAFVESFGEVFDKAIDKPLIKTIPNQDQEQDHEQKKGIGEKATDLQSPQVNEVFAHWQVVMSHPHAKLDVKRQKKIQAALNLGYNADQLKLAIDGCAHTPFNMGQNDKHRKFNGIDLIMRDADHIEGFIESASNLSMNSLSTKVSQIDQISEGAI